MIFRLSISFLVFLFVFVLPGCKDETLPAENKTPVDTTLTVSEKKETKDADAAAIIARKQVPVLCYHQLREWRSKDSRVAKDYIVPPAKFREQIKMLADSGYHSILPDQLLNYLKKGTPLPAKPVMLTFDDTDLSQYELGAAELDKYGFKGVFFIMTVSIGRPGYMTREQIADLSAKGHVIGCHTWDHHNVKKYLDPDWSLQVDKPKKQLETITGKPVKYFAYPFGLWNEEAIQPLQTRGFNAAFQLSEKRSGNAPLFTIRRMIVPGYWELRTVERWIRQNF
ncbi:MAG TPA: polysaccharide deacetylase family protein [Flavitalea sp.]|nr:polysaccharide deacetylase family protein [Flavitalea sp.]